MSDDPMLWLVTGPLDPDKLPDRCRAYELPPGTADLLRQWSDVLERMAADRGPIPAKGRKPCTRAGAPNNIFCTKLKAPYTFVVREPGYIRTTTAMPKRSRHWSP